MITSFNVCTESKYTEPANKVSADPGTDVMKNAMKKHAVIVTRIEQVIEKFKNKKERNLEFSYSRYNDDIYYR